MLSVDYDSLWCIAALILQLSCYLLESLILSLTHEVLSCHPFTIHSFSGYVFITWCVYSTMIGGEKQC